MYYMLLNNSLLICKIRSYLLWKFLRNHSGLRSVGSEAFKLKRKFCDVLLIYDLLNYLVNISIEHFENTLFFYDRNYINWFSRYIFQKNITLIQTKVHITVNVKYTVELEQ